jgi:replicative DNA helicase
MMTASYLPANQVFADWRDDLFAGEQPTLYRIGGGELSRIEIGPGWVTLLGGAPASGKTALTMQWATDALRLNPDLRIVCCNVEMSANTLLDRQLARLSGINGETIRNRQIDPQHTDRRDIGLEALQGISDRLCFVQPPFDLDNIAASYDAFDAQMLLLDYIQRIAPSGQHRDKRGSIDAAMTYLRKFADAGAAILVVSALSRQKDDRGRSSYDANSLTLASFRESSELEYGADDAFILAPDAKAEGVVTLRHVKSRHSEPRDIRLKFDRKRQSFTSGFEGEQE